MGRQSRGGGYCFINFWRYPRDRPTLRIIDIGDQLREANMVSFMLREDKLIGFVVRVGTRFVIYELNKPLTRSPPFFLRPIRALGSVDVFVASFRMGFTAPIPEGSRWERMRVGGLGKKKKLFSSG
ncbi:RNA-binding (RRM/RBD/RNP motifs) family protein [Striga asiatica]|uniref:RNA-binding (RRM/RBD/RNP motifs) family protein n=1 Tax=Striga asiatica TaxID=4170 RepID=A0A5A7PSL3_STRAF|nr:RNA-binding (RRM/RBD/RNP motifs) family protein [Striga asiatica]